MPDEVLASAEVQEHIDQLFGFIPSRFANPNSYLTKIFPTAVRLLRHAKPPTTGSLLNELFTNAVDNPEVYGWLHKEMADYWPAPREELSPYEPSQIFTDARSRLESDSQESWSSDLLYSMKKMVELGCVDRENVRHVLTGAVSIWPYHPDVALAAIEAFGESPPVDDIAGLIASTEAEDQDSIERLARAWNHVAPLKSNDEKLEIARSILSSQATDNADGLDVYLRMWIDAQSNQKTALFRSIFRQMESFNDGQTHRVWIQVDRCAAELEKQFFVDVLPTVLSDADEHLDTAKAVLESQEILSNIFSSNSDQSTLAESLMGAFLIAPSLEFKRNIAIWIRNIGGQVKIRKLSNYGEFTENDLQILLEEFPTYNKILSRYLEDLKNTDDNDDAGEQN